MKTITIGDVHGLDSWKRLKNNPQQYDKIIFIGDYVDDQFIPSSEILENLKEIMAFKEQFPDKVVLLIGNHDVQYMMGEIQSSGYDAENAEIYHELLTTDILDMAFQHEHYLWTHAGVNKLWEDKYLLSVPKEQYAVALNEMFRENEGRRQLIEVGPRRGGMHKTGGPLWCDYSEIKAYPAPGLTQIFGHTPVQEIEETVNKDYTLVNCNCLPTTTAFYELEIN